MGKDLLKFEIEGNLESLEAMKDQLMYSFLEDDQLMKALIINDENCLSESLDSYLAAQALRHKDLQRGSINYYIHKNIFTYKWMVPETIDTKESYITMDFLVFGDNRTNTNRSHFKDFSFAIYVITHKDLMRIVKESKDGFINRTDYMIRRVDAILNGSRNFGIGKLKFGGSSNLNITNDIVGSVITYHALDFGKKLKDESDEN